MSAQMMQKIAPGWRRVATPRYKKDYTGKHVTAADFSRARYGDRSCWSKKWCINHFSRALRRPHKPAGRGRLPRGASLL